MTKSITPALVSRTSGGLREALFDELDGIRKGTVDATRANAVAKVAKTIVETVRMELQLAKFSIEKKTTAKPNKRLDRAVA